ncbi:DUF982 domain-containing protein [Rhizobium wenxiniae]|uniref:DUF982 domain-containing protein n=1 Tax=Rhizobium wenxiniae TaxID=1737357 RepID=UPI001C6F17D2|nr:DUF982 domain-containing protein [Rhizobium wenxiniae]
MNSVIPVGFGLEWEFAVFVQNGLFDKAITGPRDALKYLQEDIKFQTGRPYRSAVADCMMALRFRCDAEIARSSFIAAYADYMVKKQH